MNLELRSPEYERESIHISEEVSDLSIPFNGTLCSAKGDEYEVKNNIIDLLGQEPGASSIAEYTNHWKLTASIYEEIWRKRSLSLLTGEDFPIEKEHELLIEWTAPEKDSLYMDVGTSTGLYARAVKAAQKDCTVVGLDFSSQMLEEARMKAEADETDMFLIRAEASEMPFFSSIFDGLVMGGTLNELSEPQKVLFEMKRVIKDGGKVFMMHLVKADAWYTRLLQDSISLGGIKFWTVSDSNDMFAKAGFSVEEQLVKGIVCFSLLKG